MIFIGIDPGKAGAIVAIDKNAEIISMDVMPTIGKEIDLYTLYALFNRYKGAKAVLEKVSARPGMANMFKFGRTYGMIESMLVANAMPYELSHPSTWQKQMFTGIEKTLEPKKKSLMAAKMLYPNESFLATPRSRKPHDGLTDAILIAEYCRRKFSK